MLTRYFQDTHQWPYIFILSITLLFLSACDTTNTDNGEVVIGLTDAEGDYASYTVDVQSLTLTRRDGTVVETLPLNTRVDFAQYTELTEFLTAATVPAGVYTKASMVLDYSNADIQVEDALGHIVPVTVNQDLDGNPVQILEMSVHLEDRDQLRITPGTPAHMTLDFDLKASNTVEFSDTDVIQTVSPFLLADVELETPKPHRVRGPLDSVNIAAEQFKLILRPFHHTFANDDRRFGTLNVQTNDETIYEIDNLGYIGAEGLNQLNEMPQFTAVIAIGELALIESQRVYVASEVYAGSSVPGGDQDVVKGHVIARTDDTVQLKGVTLLREDGTVTFNNEVTVILADSTIVTKQLSTDTHTIDEISVGQKLSVFGEITGDSTSTTELIVDASNGMARMRLTTVRGSVVQVDSPLALDLQSIGRRTASLFDFTGTGVDTASDADVDFYEINTAALNLSNVALNEAIKVRGFVRAFGLAPEDFDAQTLILIADAKAQMMVNWEPASSTAFSEITDSSITLDISGTGRFHHVNRSGVLTDLTTLLTNPVLIPDESGTGTYVINITSLPRVFTSFTEFTETLSELINTNTVSSIQAAGKFNEENTTMTIRHMRVKLK